MRESLRRNVLFFQHDLVGDHAFGEMHVILCRNVFIYFGPELQERTATKLAHSLCPGGFLGLGSAERLPPALRRHFSEVTPDQRIYRYGSQSAPHQLGRS
jgi:chemotaxis protein methyltransferase CheR